MTEALAAYGTLVKVGDGGDPETFATIAELLDISGPNWRLSTEDATNHSSPSAWGEKIATIKDGDDITFQVNYVPDGTSHGYTSGLLKLLDDRALTNFQVVFPDTGSTTWEFAGYVAGVGPGAPVRGKLTAAITISIAAAPTLA